MKSTNSILILSLFLFPIIIGPSLQAQLQPNQNNTRQVGNMLQRLERSSGKFRDSLNVALVQRSVDQTQPQNDINTFQSGLDLAIKQFRDQFARRLAVAWDVESILQKASPINKFINQNTLNPRVRNDWATVRTELNTLANAYGISWQWNQLTPMKVDSNRSFRLSEREINQLIQQIENGGDTFRASLTDAFFQRPYDRTNSESKMNDALRAFKRATDQVRIRFDARQLVADDVRRLLDQAQPLDNFMRDNALTDGARNDWATLRVNLGVIANVYNVTPSWMDNSSFQIGHKGTNLGAIAGGGKKAAIGGIIGEARLSSYSGQRQPRASEGHGTHVSIEWAKVKMTINIRGTNLMSEEVVVLKTFNNEIEAGMAQQVLQEAGVTAFVFKDDAGGMEPQLQRTNGVRVVVHRADAHHAHKMLKT